MAKYCSVLFKSLFATLLLGLKCSPKYNVSALDWIDFIQLGSLSPRSRLSSQPFIVAKIVPIGRNLYPVGKKRRFVIYGKEIHFRPSLSGSLVSCLFPIITIENSWFCYSLAGLASSGFGYRRPGPHHFHSHGSEMMKQIHQVSPKYIIIKASPTDKKPTFKGALIKKTLEFTEILKY